MSSATGDERQHRGCNSRMQVCQHDKTCACAPAFNIAVVISVAQTRSLPVSTASARVPLVCVVH